MNDQTRAATLIALTMAQGKAREQSQAATTVATVYRASIDSPTHTDDERAAVTRVAERCEALALAPLDLVDAIGDYRRSLER